MVQGWARNPSLANQDLPVTLFLEALGEKSLVSGGIAVQLEHESGAWVILPPHVESLPQSRASTEQNSALQILEGTI